MILSKNYEEYIKELETKTSKELREMRDAVYKEILYYENYNYNGLIIEDLNIIYARLVKDLSLILDYINIKDDEPYGKNSFFKYHSESTTCPRCKRKSKNIRFCPYCKFRKLL